MQTQKVRVFFDVRRYNEKLAREQRQMLADGENITASVCFDADKVPAWLVIDGKIDGFARPFATKSERDAAAAEKRTANNNAYAVKFKIGASCKWYNENAIPMPRPTNEELEDGKWYAVFDCTRKEADANNKLKPCGYWVNAVMLERINDNPFAAFQPINAMTAAATTDEQPANEVTAETATATATAADELPF